MYENKSLSDRELVTDDNANVIPARLTTGMPFIAKPAYTIVSYFYFTASEKNQEVVGAHIHVPGISSNYGLPPLRILFGSELRLWRRNPGADFQ